MCGLAAPAIGCVPDAGFNEAPRTFNWRAAWHFNVSEKANRKRRRGIQPAAAAPVPKHMIPTDIFNKCAYSIFHSFPFFSFFFGGGGVVKFKQLWCARQRICATAFRDVMCRIGLIKHAHEEEEKRGKEKAP